MKCGNWREKATHLNLQGNMVKMSLPCRPKRSELKALVLSGKSRGLSQAEALKWAMGLLNTKYNRVAHAEQRAPWVKPKNFDQEWWNGKLLAVRLGVQPTKQEARRDREQRRKLEAMIRASDKRKLLSLERLGRHFRFRRRLNLEDAPSSKEVAFDPQKKVVFSPFPDSEEEEMHRKFVEATDLAREMLQSDDIVEVESCLNDDMSELSSAMARVWDLPRNCGTTVVESSNV
tara:strand:+ start:215 stop:910 length:696 start_codon:yes stop_codon:yes gene_type:complete